MNPYDDLDLEARRSHPRLDEYDEAPDPPWLRGLTYASLALACALTCALVLEAVSAWWPQ